MLYRFACTIVLLLLTGNALSQTEASGDHVTVRLLAPDALAAGQTTRLGFYFEVDPEWHVYWQNAGDSGAAPRFDIKVTGGEAGAIGWPFPARLPVEHLTNLGYHGNVAYLFDLTPSPTPDNNTLTLNVDLEWLVCKIECIPGFGQLAVKLPVESSGAQAAQNTTRWPADDQALIEHFTARLPHPAANSPWQPRQLTTTPDNQLRLTLTGSATTPDVFPLDGNLMTGGAPVITREGDQIHYTFARLPGSALPKTTGFVVSDGEQAWQFDDIAIDTLVPKPANETSTPATALWLLLLAAFTGGILLNLMPCVFPVLSIKLFGLVDTEGGTSRRLREGLLYSAGVLATFAALGALLLALRAGGAAIGWGFQLQSPGVVLALIVLFWLMALAFSGVFEFGHRLMNLAGSSRGGAFVTGVLAVFVAAPCTGPFMGAALGAAAVLPAASAMGIFISLGAGLAAPFLLLAASPALLKRLPAPGPWMDTLRQLLAFPLYATVIWLLWVLGKLLGDSGWVAGCVTLLLLGFALWLGQRFARVGRVLGWLVTLGALALAASAVQRAPAPAAGSAETFWQPYDKTAIAAARTQGQAVFIDYTAAWCITCQVNKKLVLDTDHTTALFTRHKVLAIRADWTRHDPAITEALAALGRNSVPVYAWYAPGEAVQLLPQLLQERMITDLFHSSDSL